MHRTTSRFWDCFHGLPAPIQSVAEEKFDLLKRDPRQPSLHFKTAGKFWSARAGLDHRALAVQDGPDFIWVWIGSHDQYERLLKLSG